MDSANRQGCVFHFSPLRQGSKYYEEDSLKPEEVLENVITQQGHVVESKIGVIFVYKKQNGWTYVWMGKGKVPWDSVRLRTWYTN